MSFTAGFTCLKLPAGFCAFPGPFVWTLDLGPWDYCSIMQEVLHFQSTRKYLGRFKVNGVHVWPNNTWRARALIHTLQQMLCKLTSARTVSFHRELLYALAVFQDFQVYSYRPKVRVRGSQHCSFFFVFFLNNHAGALLSSSQLEQENVHLLTQLRTHIEKKTHTHAHNWRLSHALAVMTTLWTPCSCGILLLSCE